MNNSDRQRIDVFLARWQDSVGNERANYQGFFLDLCTALGVEPPPPKGNVPGDPYCFDKDIRLFTSERASTQFADFYKEGCFLIEAKQGSIDSGKGHGKRGTKVYRDNLQKAFNQARAYAYNRMLPSLPPFLMVCDIGSHFEVWEGFSGDYGGYGARKRVNLADLKQPEVFDRFVQMFTDPQALNPEKLRARVTREVAAELAKLSRWLEDQGHDAHTTANFLMRCIFTMFAEDVELLKDELFTTALRDRWMAHPEAFQPEIEQLWQTMNTGGNFGFARVLRFNGSFFDQATAIPLPKEQLEVLYAAAAKDWSQVEPAIFGTLLERALEKKERSRLGAHYTPRSYVERLIRPVVMEPLRQEWDEIELELKRLLEPEAGKEEPTQKQRKKAEEEIRAFLEKLRTIKILDPACGTGNFLYVALDLMKGLEQEVQNRLVDVAGEVQLGLEQVNPSQFLGIEINPRAAAIAELVIWIGYLQWHFKRFGNAAPPEPVLQAFGNIENRDAVLAYDGTEPDVDPKTGKVRTRWGGRKMKHPVTGEDVPDPTDQVVIYKYLNPRPAEWPKADYVVSNPPFVGNRDMRELFGDGYTEALRQRYPEVPETIDYVMYWWHKSALLIENKSLQRFGLITTNTIRQIRQRGLIDLHQKKKNGIQLFIAIPDHPWESEGASVRISMTGGRNANEKASICSLGEVVVEKKASTPEEEAASVLIEWRNVGYIFDDLRAGVNVSSAIPLKAQVKLCCPGVKPYGSGFIISENELQHFPERERVLIKQYINGRDLTQTSRNAYIIDCYGVSIEEIKNNYPVIYQWLLEKVYPERMVERDLKIKDKWWIFERPRPDLRSAINNVKRYIGTVQTSKHRIFVFINSDVLPDQQVIAVSVGDAYFLGVLSSSIHVKWCLSAGGTLEDRPRYNNSVCFDPFPFPDPTPEQKQKIRELGERLDAHRKQVQAAHPDITITGMYNLLEKLRAGEPFTDADRDYNNRALVSTLKQIHDELDHAVLDAYGWPHDITDEQILENLVALNAQRAEEERNGLIRWLRPEYQAPDQAQAQQTTLEGVTAPEETIVEPVEQRKWPTQPKAQLAAIRDLLRTSSGEWTVHQIAAQFTGKTTQKKLDAITDNLERLEWFSLVVPETHDGITYWHYTEPLSAA